MIQNHYQNCCYYCSICNYYMWYRIIVHINLSVDNNKILSERAKKVVGAISIACIHTQHTKHISRRIWGYAIIDSFWKISLLKLNLVTVLFEIATEGFIWVHDFPIRVAPGIIVEHVATMRVATMRVATMRVATMRVIRVVLLE